MKAWLKRRILLGTTRASCDGNSVVPTVFPFCFVSAAWRVVISRPRLKNAPGPLFGTFRSEGKFKLLASRAFERGENANVALSVLGRLASKVRSDCTQLRRNPLPAPAPGSKDKRNPTAKMQEEVPRLE